MILRRGSINVDAKIYFIDVNNNQRLQVCGLADSLLNKNPVNPQLIIDSISVASLGKTSLESVQNQIQLCFVKMMVLFVMILVFNIVSF